uniref:Uncharacterized protein n=1 Tax=Aegilops tauschii subsp. strangulata TaxID=200361 RepID=A0A453EII4_AEGTS
LPQHDLKIPIAVRLHPTHLHHAPPADGPPSPVAPLIVVATAPAPARLPPPAPIPRRASRRRRPGPGAPLSIHRSPPTPPSIPSTPPLPDLPRRPHPLARLHLTGIPHLPGNLAGARRLPPPKVLPVRSTPLVSTPRRRRLGAV